MVFAVFVAGVVAGRLGASVLRAARRGVPPPPWCCEVGVAALWAAAALPAPPWWWLPVPLAVGWFGVLLAVCDVRARRLPDVLTLPIGPVLAVLLAFAAPHRPGVLVGAVVGVVLFGGTYLLVRAAVPAALGAGDVKLALGLGAAVGAVVWWAVLVVVLVAAGLTLLAARRCARVPHGPAMLAPAWVVTAFPELLANVPPAGSAVGSSWQDLQVCCVG
ncbi:prepilin peptidase [Saccharopolyspora rosea]|uniref:prepilin peptidase n=1 Tax=Saccharopolyspora rosea TaxID=524884 RepID=UPI0021DA7441|nr:A24 family peptidase [Saccharopolyspora rosea]